MPSIIIGDHSIDDSSGPYIIAEIGVNHEGSLNQAKLLIEMAKKGGAHAVKFQSYKAEALASKDSPAYWDITKEPTTSQYELFKKFDGFGPDEYADLARHSKSVGIDFISTPFDSQAVEFLAPLVPCFKIASADLTNIPLIRQVAAHGKPVLISTGGCTLAEIDIAVKELREGGSAQIVLLHCILDYPTDDQDAHLAMIQGLRRAYPDLVIGYSDHTVPDQTITTLGTAYLLGARVLEKHFTHDKTLSGNDHYHAMDCDDLSRFVNQLELVRTLVGESDHKQPTLAEQTSRLYARRSIVLAQDIDAGTILTEEMLTTKRPGVGISPLNWDDVIGQRLLRSLEADHILQWRDVVAEFEQGTS